MRQLNEQNNEGVRHTYISKIMSVEKKNMKIFILKVFCLFKTIFLVVGHERDFRYKIRVTVPKTSRSAGRKNDDDDEERRWSYNFFIRYAYANWKFFE